MKTIYTIGHSTRTFDEFVQLLIKNNIHALVDVRSLPGSRKFPQFNLENLAKELPHLGIQYFHIEKLGGRRKRKKDSHNILWRNESFRNYADYMETIDFLEGIEQLDKIADQTTTAYMCSEAVWWRCHRSMISDYLKLNDWKVLHILSDKNIEEHPYTSPARIRDGKLFYYDD